MGVDALYRLPQVAPREWGAAVDYDSWSQQRNTSQAFVHHVDDDVPPSVERGEVSAERAMLRSIESYHRRKGYSGIAYDWAIGQSGTLYRLRGGARSAGTGGDIDRDGLANNVEGEAILVLIGNEALTPEALHTLTLVLDTLNRRAETYGHQESAQEGTGTVTSCPGPVLMDYVQRYRAGAFSHSYGGWFMDVLVYARRDTFDAELASLAARSTGAGFTTDVNDARKAKRAGVRVIEVGGHGEGVPQDVKGAEWVRGADRFDTMAQVAKHSRGW